MRGWSKQPGEILEGTYGAVKRATENNKTQRANLRETEYFFKEQGVGSLTAF